MRIIDWSSDVCSSDLVACEKLRKERYVRDDGAAVCGSKRNAGLSGKPAIHIPARPAGPPEHDDACDPARRPSPGSGCCRTQKTHPPPRPAEREPDDGRQLSCFSIYGASVWWLVHWGGWFPTTTEM